MNKDIFVKVLGRDDPKGQGRRVPIEPGDTLANLKQKLGMNPGTPMDFVSENRGGSLPENGGIADFVQEDEVFQGTPGLQLG